MNVHFIFCLMGMYLVLGCSLSASLEDLNLNSSSKLCVEGFNALPCITPNSNTYVSDNLGLSVAGAPGALTMTIPPGYYDGSTIARIDDSQLVDTNIKKGTTILGVTGSYTGFSDVMISTQFRDKTQLPMTLSAEASAGSAYGNNSTGYRAVPDINKDDDGLAGSSVTRVNRTGWRLFKYSSLA